MQLAIACFMHGDEAIVGAIEVLSIEPRRNLWSASTHIALCRSPRSWEWRRLNRLGRTAMGRPALTGR